MAAVEIPDVVYELLERSVRQSDSYETIPELVESISKEYLMKRDLYGRMHAPISVILKNSADNLIAIRILLEKIEWQDRRTAMNEVVNHIESAAAIIEKEIDLRTLDQE